MVDSANIRGLAKMAEENGAAVLPEPQTISVPNRADEMRKFLDERAPAASESSSEYVVDDAPAPDPAPSPEPSDPSPEPTPPPKTEGPSLAMKAAASHFIPREYIETAASDEQLQQWIDLSKKQMEQIYDQQNGPAPQQPAPPDPAAKDPDFYELPIDEFPEDDPVRKAVTSIQSKYDRSIDQLREDMATAIGMLSRVEGDYSARQENNARSFQQVLDAQLDASGQYGKFSQDMPEPLKEVRGKIFEGAYQWHQANPHIPPEQVCSSYLEQLGVTPQSTPPTGPIARQAQRRLGGGNAPKAPEPQLTREQEMRKFLDGLRNGRR